MGCPGHQTTSVVCQKNNGLGDAWGGAQRFKTVNRRMEMGMKRLSERPKWKCPQCKRKFANRNNRTSVEITNWSTILKAKPKRSVISTRRFSKPSSAAD